MFGTSPILREKRLRKRACFFLTICKLLTFFVSRLFESHTWNISKVQKNILRRKNKLLYFYHLQAVNSFGVETFWVECWELCQNQKKISVAKLFQKNDLRFSCNWQVVNIFDVDDLGGSNLFYVGNFCRILKKLMQVCWSLHILILFLFQEAFKLSQKEFLRKNFSIPRWAVDSINIRDQLRLDSICFQEFISKRKERKNLEFEERW